MNEFEKSHLPHTIKNIRNTNFIYLKYWNLGKNRYLHEICHKLEIKKVRKQVRDERNMVANKRFKYYRIKINPKEFAIPFLTALC